MHDEVDDEGVAASKVSLIDKGQLVNYLLGRQPIRDFPSSNGHGRAGPGQAASPNLGTLMLQSSEPVSTDDLKKKLIDLCREENRPYGYLVATLYGGNPRLLYRVYVQDGHEELVRGAAAVLQSIRYLARSAVALTRSRAAALTDLLRSMEYLGKAAWSVGIVYPEYKRRA